MAAAPLSTGAYPRSCGETLDRHRAHSVQSGLSPLVRGNLQHRHQRHQVERPIPARAGKPFVGFQLGIPIGAYPRSCGETRKVVGGCKRERGLSPLVRGNRLSVSVSKSSPGPIPARAGKPRHPRYCGVVRGAYPRSCGETRMPAGPSKAARGLSPLVRGNPRICPPCEAVYGPIPARAGKPAIVVIQTRWHGPIPARAGKPQAAAGDRRLIRAYPRSCGETSQFCR